MLQRGQTWVSRHVEVAVYDDPELMRLRHYFRIIKNIYILGPSSYPIGQENVSLVESALICNQPIIMQFYILTIISGSISNLYTLCWNSPTSM